MNLHGKPELRERLAAEYALGTLRRAARARLQRWMRTDPELSREVAAWEARLAPLAEAIPPAPPPARLWRRIERRLDGAQPRAALWKALGWVTAGAGAALVALAALLPPQPASVPQTYLAVLSDPQSRRVVMIASAERREARLRIKTLDPSIHVAGRSLELWALPEGGKPRSLGLISSEKSDLKLATLADDTLGNVPALAVSLEPPGGSPTGQPSGPVLYSGPCVKYW